MMGSSVCAEQQHKFHHSHQLYLTKKALREIDIPPRKLLGRRSPAPEVFMMDSPKAEDAVFSKFLPYNNVDDDDDDPYSSDHFRDVRVQGPENATGAGATTGPTARSPTRARRPPEGPEEVPLHRHRLLGVPQGPLRQGRQLRVLAWRLRVLATPLPLPHRGLQGRQELQEEGLLLRPTPPGSSASCRTTRRSTPPSHPRRRRRRSTPAAVFSATP
ncbi:zinc finger CCCH domain-containing protein 23 [Phtheirospermum japonicum]|uniref:Zinc finger CCCH domain-containing protein 23 n=1 Tax=Phtheirospermum japonicum TaxID=374723 RepID=A0A830BGI6_9LAMI|nr:zinc finger CCCH domain-containing protein 23 [Phtheirospermum japonicum]